MRKLPLLLAAVMAVAVLVPAHAQAFKPKIVYVRATDDDEGIRFTAKVRMDKGGRDQRKVSVAYKDERKNAKSIGRPPLSMFETGPFRSRSGLLQGHRACDQSVRHHHERHASRPDRHERLRLGRVVAWRSGAIGRPRARLLADE